MAKAKTSKPKPAFRHRRAAYKHLIKTGYHLSEQKVYKDAAKGLLRLQPDGSILASELSRYAATIVQPDKMPETEPAAQLVRQKLETEIHKLREQVRNIKFKNEVDRGKYIECTIVETAQAIKAAALHAGLKHMFEAYSRESVELSGGKLTKTRQVINFWHAKIDSLLDEFARLDEIEAQLKA